MSNLNSTFSSLNSSKDAEELLNVTINEKTNKSNSSKATSKQKKRKTVEIKIKLDISDVSEDNEHVKDDGEEEEQVAEFKATTIKKIASKISVNAKEGKLFCENEEQVFSTAMKRMSSRVSLSIKDDNKQIENHEETLYFDINSQSDDKSNIATLIESLSGPHNHSVWHKIFEKIHNSYQTACDDKKIVDVINELIMEKYKQALNILKQRVEKREQNKTNNKTLDDSNDFCEQEKTFEDFKVNLESKEGSKLKNTAMRNTNNTAQNKVDSQEIGSPCRNLLDISNDKLANDLKAYNEKYEPKYQFLNASKIDNHVPENQFSFCKERSFSDDILISFENDLKKENVRSFLKAEGENMYEDINKIFDSEISLEENIVEYDSRKFLRSALGEDIYSSFDSQVRIF